MKRQVNFRASPSTAAKLLGLTARYGTQAEVVAVAIDRLYASEPGLIRVAKETGHFDFVALSEDFKVRIEAVGQEQARRELIAALTAHVIAIMPDADSGHQRTQVRLAANGIFAELGQPVYEERESLI